MVSGSERPGRPIGVLALQAAEARRERLRLVEVDAGGVDAADLEDQRLDLRQRRLPVKVGWRGRCRLRRRGEGRP